MGNTCRPMAVSFQCMTKFTTNKKKIIQVTSTILLLMMTLNEHCSEARMSLWKNHFFGINFKKQKTWVRGFVSTCLYSGLRPLKARPCHQQQMITQPQETRVFVFF